MNKFNVTAIAAAISLVFNISVMAQSMSKDAYKAANENIATEYATDKKNCDPLSGNIKDICIAEAKGKDKVAKAELEASYEPTAKNRYQSHIAKAEAGYTIANEKCDDKVGNDKDLCVKEAKAVEVQIKADAEAQMKIANANEIASDKSAEAEAKAKEVGVEARQEASADKLDANYAVAKEKCDSLTNSGDKDRCVNEAKAKYGK